MGPAADQKIQGGNFSDELSPRDGEEAEGVFSEYQPNRTQIAMAMSEQHMLNSSNYTMPTPNKTISKVEKTRDSLARAMETMNILMGKDKEEDVIKTPTPPPDANSAGPQNSAQRHAVAKAAGIAAAAIASQFGASRVEVASAAYSAAEKQNMEKEQATGIAGVAAGIAAIFASGGSAAKATAAAKAAVKQFGGSEATEQQAMNSTRARNNKETNAPQMDLGQSRQRESSDMDVTLSSLPDVDEQANMESLEKSLAHQMATQVRSVQGQSDAEESRDGEDKDSLMDDLESILSDHDDGSNAASTVSKSKSAPMPVATSAATSAPTAEARTRVQRLQAEDVPDEHSVMAVEAGFEVASPTHFSLNRKPHMHLPAHHLALAGGFFGTDVSSAVNLDSLDEGSSSSRDLDAASDLDLGESDTIGDLLPLLKDTADVSLGEAIGSSSRVLQAPPPESSPSSSNSSSSSSEDVDTKNVGICRASEMVICDDESDQKDGTHAELQMDGVLSLRGDDIAKQKCSVHARSECVIGCAALDLPGYLGLNTLGGTCAIDLVSKLSCDKSCEGYSTECAGEGVRWKDGSAAQLQCKSSVPPAMMKSIVCGCEYQCSPTQIAECRNALTSMV